MLALQDLIEKMRRRGWMIAPITLMVLAPLALGQNGATPPALRPELQQAMAKADAGDPAPLTAMADAGAADAQYYAGVMYIFGRGKIARDPARGCAYEDKASASRSDAMNMVGLCYQNGGFGAPDKAKAEAAFTRADAMGFPKAKCALGQMLMSDPAQAERGIGLCKEVAKAGDLDAQKVVAEAYFNGTGVKADHGEARKWYDMAAKQSDPDSMRKLGVMYAGGDGGKKDTKKALELWMRGEKAGDPLTPILVADQLFTDVTGKRPGPGKYAFKGGIPKGDLGVVEDWYKEAQQVDPRPEVKTRAEYALKILASLKTAADNAAR
jgi:TPR repeat protein